MYTLSDCQYILYNYIIVTVSFSPMKYFNKYIIFTENNLFYSLSNMEQQKYVCVGVGIGGMLSLN